MRAIRLLVAGAIGGMVLVAGPVVLKAQYQDIERRILSQERVNADRRIAVLETKFDGIEKRFDGLERLGTGIIIGVAVQLILSGLSFKQSQRGPRRATDDIG